MSCLDENMVTEYLDGQLPEEVRGEIESHLDRCEDCRSLVSAVVRGMDHAASRNNALGSGDRVEHYQVIRLLGSGAMGEVYLCRDTRLGRRVALKVIRADPLESPTSVRRFLNEARTTARFSHPHIVTIYDVGQWRQRPYLALEYLEGQTLRQRMDEERQSVREILRVGLAVAEALTEAHRNNVLHRDLKPANVLLPRDGRLRVVDFGLAKELPRMEAGAAGLLDTVDLKKGADEVPRDGSASLMISQGGMILGTPAYMAPEQWNAAECTEVTDIWALGVILYELVTRRRPFEGSSFSEIRAQVTSREPAADMEGSEPVPEIFSRLVMSCLEKDPGRRPAAARAASTMRQLLRTGRTRVQEESPFRGLLPFSERHAELFFGREGEVGAFLEQLREQGVLPVVGPSGAGKTSFVQAGVIPRLREQASWLVLQLRPGERPFDSLAARLIGGESLSRSASQSFRSVSGDPLESPVVADRRKLARELFESPLRLNLFLRQLAEHHRCRVLLVVDQLEELCTMAGDDPVQRQAFMKALSFAGDDPDDPVRVIYTLRDDFLGRLAVGPHVRESMGHLTIIHSPEPDALEEIVTSPLAVMGYRYDDRELPRRMVAEVGGEPAALPLLQFTTRQLWDRRDRQRKLLLYESYDALGGVAGALARHADRLLEGLAPPEERLARQILLRLVNPDGTRKAMQRSALLGNLDAAAPAVLDRLVHGRLLSLRKSLGDPEARAEVPIVDDAQIELVHESLVWSWARLARWIDESREELAFWSDVGQAADIWARRGRPGDEVWQGKELHDAIIRSERSVSGIPEPVASFLAQGQRREQHVQRRTRRRVALAALTLVLVSVVSVVMALTFSSQRQEAAAQRDQARIQRSSAQREGARAALVQVDMIQAWAKLRSSLETEDSSLARALWHEMGQRPEQWHRQLGGNVYDVTFSPDGGLVAAACQDKAIYLIDTRTARFRVLRGHEDQVFAMAFSPEGNRLASGTWSGDVRIWDLRRRAVKLLPGHTAAVWRLAFSPDGRKLASASWDRTVRIWDLIAARTPRVIRGHTDRVYGVAFSPDGRLLATAGFDRTVRIWNAHDGKSRRVLRGHTDRVYTVAWSPDGKTLASGSLDRSVMLWRPENVLPFRKITGHVHGVYGVAFSPDGEWIVSSGWDRHGIRAHDLASRREPIRLTGHDARVYSVAFSPRGRHLVSAGADNTVRFWEMSSSRGASPGGSAKRGGHGGVTWGVAFSPDGKMLASSSRDRTIRLWSVARGETTKVLTGHDAIVTGIAFSPDGKRLASVSADRTVRIWDPGTGTQKRVLTGHLAAVHGVAFRPDGKVLASAGSDKMILRWDVSTGSMLSAPLRHHTGAIWSLDYNHDGSALASASADKTICLWDPVRDGSCRVLAGHTGTVYGVAFSPDGKELASGSADRTVRTWDVASGRSKILGQHDGRVYYLSYHPDGKRLGTPGSDGVVRLWSLDRQVLPGLWRGHRGEVNMIRFSPDGGLAATSSDDGTVQIWKTSSGRPVWRTVLVTDDPPAVLSHRGWSGGKRDPGARAVAVKVGGPLSRTLGRDGLTASLHSAGGLRTLCVITQDGQLAYYQLPGKLLFREPLAAAREVHALPHGCLALLPEQLRLYGRDGAFKQIPLKVRALAPDPDGFLAAGKHVVRLFDHRGEELKRYASGVGVTSVVRTKRYLALGFEEGNIELHSLTNVTRARTGTPPDPDMSLDDVPSTPAVILRAGPMQTLIGGFASGSWGIWSTKNGKRLVSGNLHGSIMHLGRTGTDLMIVSILGQHQRVSLEAFHQKYCTVLRKVWDRVPVVWDNGLPVVEPPPKSHPCLLSGR